MAESTEAIGNNPEENAATDQRQQEKEAEAEKSRVSVDITQDDKTKPQNQEISETKLEKSEQITDSAPHDPQNQNQKAHSQDFEGAQNKGPKQDVAPKKKATKPEAKGQVSAKNQTKSNKPSQAVKGKPKPKPTVAADKKAQEKPKNREMKVQNGAKEIKQKQQMETNGEVTSAQSSLKDISQELHNDSVYDAEKPSTDLFQDSLHDPDDDLLNSNKELDSKTTPEQEQKEQQGIKKEEKNSLVLGPNIPLIDVLSNPVAMKFFQIKNKQIINYFCVKIDGLVNICFDKNQPELSKKAFEILLSNEHKIISTFIKADRFQMLGAEITSLDHPDMLGIGRFTALLSGILDHYPEHLVNNCGFLIRLLHHCDNPSVARLFAKFCKNDPKFESLQKYLINFGFSDILYRELVAFRHKTYDHPYEYYSSSEIYRTAALYRILANCLLSPTLMPSVATVNFITLCEIEYDPSDHTIDDEKWLVILAFYNQNFDAHLLNFVYPAVMKMREAKTYFYPCHYYALKFLSYIIKNSPETEDLLMATDFLAQLLRMLFTFYESPFFQDAFSKFIASAIHLEKICVDVVQMIIPAVMGMISDDKSISFRACAYLILSNCQSLREYLPVLEEQLTKLSGFSEFYEERILLRHLLIDLKYGEEYPGQVNTLSSEVETRDAIKLQLRSKIQSQQDLN